MTRPAPFEDFAAGGIETLFPDLPPPGARPVEVAVTVADGDSRRCVMQVVAAEADAAEAFGMAFRACAGVEDFEVVARRFKG
ncbi:MAG TPA: hypothetical protein VK599_03765 [Streptosporangiaceae bacterium]|nr:hypothetical protein [Streptosporangiaceae bacterium]